MTQNTDNQAVRDKALKLFKILFMILAGLLLIIYFEPINVRLGKVVAVFSPIIWGLVLSYLVNPFFRFFEQRVFYRTHPKGLRRGLSLLCAYLTFILLLGLLLLLFVPQLMISITNFINNIDTYLASAVHQYNLFGYRLGKLAEKAGIKNILQPITTDVLRQKFSSLTDSLGKLTEMFDGAEIMGASGYVIEIISDIVSATANVLFSFFVSLYLLSTKEKCYAQIMRLRSAIFKDSTNAKLTSFFTVIDRSFGGFLEGKVIDSAIIGLLTYVVVLIFDIPYPILMAAFVGLTNIIPVIGPVIGGIPTSLIVLLTDPSKVIAFIIIVIVIQQIDGNIIGPKILGNNTGISSFCVLIAITVMGNLWGLVGMLLGVPLFATVLDLTESATEKRLRAKGFSSATENYYPADSAVNPNWDISVYTDKTAQRFRKKVLKLEDKMAGGEPLNRIERFMLRFYGWTNRLNLFPEMTDEEQIATMIDTAVQKSEIASKEGKIAENEARSADKTATVGNNNPVNAPVKKVSEKADADRTVAEKIPSTELQSGSPSDSQTL